MGRLGNVAISKQPTGKMYARVRILNASVQTYSMEFHSEQLDTSTFEKGQLGEVLTKFVDRQFKPGMIDK